MNFSGQIRHLWITVLITAGILVLNQSCESVLFIELEEAERLIVVNGTISSDSTVRIQVSRTRHILDNAPVNPLEQAEARLFRNGILIGTLSHTARGYYVFEEHIPVIGDAYRIEVENAGYPTVTANCVIPGPVQIAALDTAVVKMDAGSGPYYWYGDMSLLQFDLTLQDPPGEVNYYLLNAMADRSSTRWRDTTVIIVDSIYYGGQWNYYPRDSTYAVGDVVRYTSQPHIYSSDIIVETLTNGGVLFSDRLIDGKSYSFRGTILSQSLESADSALVSFRLHSISESYYRYLKSRQEHYDSRDNYLAVPVIVYSNIESGTGFFGGYSTDEYTITTFIPEFYDYWYYEVY
ncbi:MAG TPA: DUF4249 domain-containing protein [Bacteroides sp.]|nr:DUF4249 domain-containing protein [Bacteroides sp.]